MRRKTKRLLAAGMALAVLATNLTPLSLAAETAAGMQTDEVTTQELPDETEAQTDEVTTQEPSDETGAQTDEVAAQEPSDETGAQTDEVTAQEPSDETGAQTDEVTAQEPSDEIGTQTDEAAAQEPSDEIALYGLRDHDFGSETVAGVHFSSDGTSYYASWTAKCGNDICKRAGKANFTGTTDSFGYDRVVDNCTDGKVYYFDARSVKITGTCKVGTTFYHTGTLKIGEQKYVARKPGHDLTVTWNENQATITCSHGDFATTLTGTEKFKEVVSEPTCAKEGRATYCYTVDYDGVTYESDTTFEKAIPKTEHSYEVAWSFASDNEKATATFTCKNCHDVQTQEADVTKTVVEPDCEHAGSITYTAADVVFNGATFPGGTKTVVTEKLGHSYGTPKWSWSADKSTATLTMECTRNGCGKTVNESAKVESEITTEPTCKNDGVKTFTATVTLDGKDYTATETSPVPATGHSYVPDGANAWNWTADENSATATVRLMCTECGLLNNPNATVTKDTNASKPATCTADGSVVYTATASINGQNFTDTHKVTLQKLGHEFINYVSNNDATCTEDGTKTATCKHGCGATDTVTDEGSKLDHNFDGAEPIKWDWDSGVNPFNGQYVSVTVTLPCQNENPNCTATTTAVTYDVTSSVTPSTCKTAGAVTYTARYNDYTNTVTKELPLADHVYSGEPTWTWNADHTNATATFKCDVCGETAPSTGIYGPVKVTKVEANCEENGSITYSAYVTDHGTTYTTEYVETIPATGHFYLSDSEKKTEWNEEDKTATLYYACMNCGDKQHETVQGVKDDKNSELPTCTEDGYDTYVATGAFTGVTEKDQVATVVESHPFKVNKLGHDCELTLEWDDDTYTSATATVKCSDCDYERDVPVTITAERTEPTCTGNGYIDYTATADVTYDPETEGRSPEKDSAQIYGQTILPAVGHHYGAYHCTNNGTEVAICDHCGATTTRAATGSAVCDAHTVDGASVCAVCGKVNGSALLPQITASSNANTKAITSGAQLVVRAGTLPSGQKILTVAYLDADGKVLNLTGSWKVRVSLAELQAQLGTTEGNGFEHTLTLLAPNGEKKAVGFAVENGTVTFDATFNNSTACILLVD